MGELAPVIPSALGGGALAAVIFYLLKHLSGLYRQLGDAQAASSVSATQRAERAEAEVARLALEIADREQQRLQAASDWARRTGAIAHLRTAYPDEAAKHRFIENRIEEILNGGIADVS